MMNPYDELLARIRLVRRRWRLQALTRGLSLFLCSVVVLLLLGIWGADLFGFNPAAVWAMRLITGCAAISVAWYFLYRPLRANVDDVRIARLVEENYPQLEDRLIAAVEYGRADAASSSIIDLLIRDALDKTVRVNLSVFLNRKKVASFSALGAAAVLAMTVLLLWGPSLLSYGFGRLYVPWTEASNVSPLLIKMTPGDIEIAKGADQQIEALLVGFDSPDVRLYTQPETSQEWRSSPMEPDPRGSGFRYLLLEVQSSLRYYVESRGIRSRTAAIKVVDVARADKIDLTYHFPAYTGMAPQNVQNEGDVTAIMGTRVDLRIRLSKPAQSARLLFDNGSTLNLSHSGPQDFAGSIQLKRSGTYSVQVTDDRGAHHAASPQYEIEAIPDAPPMVTVIRPMRDVRATSVEEVFSEIKAEDDIGMGKLELFYSVNGGPEKSVNLYGGRPGTSSVTGAHTFFLEEFGLQPGDIISYYGKASDNNNVTGPGIAQSDIYFIQVRPFEQRYVQNQQGMMPGGGGQDEAGQEALSRQQKEIISATFNLIRERKTLPEKEYLDGLKSLALVQSRLQGQARGLVDRLDRRGAAQTDEEFRKLSEYLKGAIAEMEGAAADLGARKPETAMPYEQKSLQQLMRAESLFRDIQVSFASQGSGNGSQANAEDLADLFELELNKLKNQYETVQRGEQQTRDQKVDEALQRLKELAQRQQQINERNRIPGQQGKPSSSGTGGSSQSRQQLLEQAEQLQRQLQRLSRERSSPDLDEAGNRIRKAIDEMKKGLNGSQKGDQTDAGAQGTRALQQLDEAVRKLERSQETGLNQGVERAAEESRGMLNEQKRIEEELNRLAGEKSEAGSRDAARQAREDLLSRKAGLAERLRNLESQARDLSRQARRSRKDAGGKLDTAADTIRDRQLPERVLGGKKLIENGYYGNQREREEEIRAGLEEVNRNLQSARNALHGSPGNKEGKLEDAANRARQLAEGLESMQQRMNQGQPGKQRSGQEPGERSGQDSKSPGDGQPPRQASAGQDGGTGIPSGDADVRSFSGNSTGAPVGSGSSRKDEDRQLGREMQRRAEDARELRQLLEGNATGMQNLENVIAALRRAGSAPGPGDPGQVESLRRAIEYMRRVEFDLARDLERLTRKDKYFSAENNEAPADYRRLVEEYYKSIARSK